MRFDELTRLVGQRIWLRQLVFTLVRMTTLREWYLYSAIKKELKKHSNNFSFLDAGCGMGQFAFRIAKKYPSAKVTGLEQVDRHDAPAPGECRVAAAPATSPGGVAKPR